MTRPEQPVLAAYAAAVAAQDTDALLALYAPEVVVFDLWGEWAYHGAPAWRAAVEEWFGSLDGEQVEASFTEVEAQQSGGAAGPAPGPLAGEWLSLSALVTYRNFAATGEPGRSMLNRLTWVLRREGEGWLIVHEHTSAPADPSSGRVRLSR